MARYAWDSLIIYEKTPPAEALGGGKWGGGEEDWAELVVSLLIHVLQPNFIMRRWEADSLPLLFF